MLVSHQKKFIFIKTRKTAGSSVQLYFEPFCHPGNEPKLNALNYQVSDVGILGYSLNSQLKQFPSSPGTTAWRSHMGAAAIRKAIGDVIWFDYYRFSTIRNPYEKNISAYFFKKYKKQLALAEPEREREQFESWLVTNGPLNDRNKYLINGSFCLDGVIRVEQLNDDVKKTCEILDIPYQPENIKRAKSNSRPAWATAGFMYSRRARDIVTEANRFELEHFGYAFPA